MPVLYCHTCDKLIDLDIEVEHFIYGTEDCASGSNFNNN